MGLIIKSLDDLPETSDRNYYIYFLEYGWKGLENALRENFDKVATSVSSHKGVVLRAASGYGTHFADEVLSWHRINGEDAEKDKLLPAILITNKSPIVFREFQDSSNKTKNKEMRMVLIPLRKFCKTPEDVVNALISITTDIKDKKDLNNFKVAKELTPGIGNAIVKGIILEPNFAGIGFSFNKMLTALGLLK